MTKKEFYEKYGDVPVTFNSYYKYAFEYSGESDDGSKITIRVGGDSNEIYRMTVTPNQPERVSSLFPYAGEVVKDGKIVDEFYDY